jgi:hypothetical protein
LLYLKAYEYQADVKCTKGLNIKKYMSKNRQVCLIIGKRGTEGVGLYRGGTATVSPPPIYLLQALSLEDAIY